MMTLTQTERVERVLVKIAEQVAPHLIQNGWKQAPNPIKRLARGLAEYNFLILMGNIPNHLVADREKYVRRWANAYAEFYKVLAQTLFPNYDALEATFADDGDPTIVVIRTQICPIVEAMAGYVVPYVANRQPHTQVPEGELRMLMDKILDTLKGDDLSRPVYNVLVKDGIVAIQRLLAQPVQHIALTDYDQPIVRDILKPPSLPKTGNLNGSPAAQVAHMVQSPAPTARITQTQEQIAFKDEFTLDELNEEPEVKLTSTSRMFTPLYLGAERKTPTGTQPPVPELPNKNGGGGRRK